MNVIMMKDSFPMPIVYELDGTTYFSKLNLRFEYHQILVKEEDRHKITFITHHDHYEWLMKSLGQ